jgi:N-acetylmuramic acid 6-phosphate (MurNAc-6-P) etherase
MSVTGASAETAAHAIASANGSVKEAVLSILTDLSAAESRKLLDFHNGQLRSALRAAEANLSE